MQAQCSLHLLSRGTEDMLQQRVPRRVGRRGSGTKHVPRSASGPPSSLTGPQGDTQLQILAAVPGLSEKLCMVEAQLSSTVA